MKSCDGDVVGYNAMCESLWPSGNDEGGLRVDLFPIGSGLRVCGGVVASGQVEPGTLLHCWWNVSIRRSWIGLLLCAVLLLPTPILLLTGQPEDVAKQAGEVSMWFIPLHFSFAFVFLLQCFLQCQLKNSVITYVSAAALIVHTLVTWVCVSKLQFGLIGTMLTLDFSWWVSVLSLFGYVTCGGCLDTWKGFSMEAFIGLWEFLRLSAASGVMLWSSLSLSPFLFLHTFLMSQTPESSLLIWCSLENWYYRILILLIGNLKNAKTAVDALSIW
ncbi:hypothetical protein Cni_G03038 [Canna indica]|uniref:Uncharacterized protein n=1 Tax=Canna indica TaxID=4628 RepID=A0AAQ3JR79_9LILI|nr:hypothetical protein Cni_G03038 [Canna indica]